MRIARVKNNTVGNIALRAQSDFDGDGLTDPAKFETDSHMLWWLGSSSSIWDAFDMGSGSYEIVN